MAKKKFSPVSNDSLFKEVQEERRYTSIVDEYRRIFQTGKIIVFESSKNEAAIFEIASQFALKQLLKEDDTKQIHTGKVFKVKSKVFNKIMIKSYSSKAPFQELIIEAIDKDNQKFRTSIKMIGKTFFRKKIKLEYSEWLKASKTFFGLSDSYKKLLLKRRAFYRAALLADYVSKQQEITTPDWAVKTIKKWKEKGKISIK